MPCPYFNSQWVIIFLEYCLCIPTKMSSTCSIVSFVIWRGYNAYLVWMVTPHITTCCALSPPPFFIRWKFVWLTPHNMQTVICMVVVSCSAPHNVRTNLFNSTPCFVRCLYWPHIIQCRSLNACDAVSSWLFLKLATLVVLYLKHTMLIWSMNV